MISYENFQKDAAQIARARQSLPNAANMLTLYNGWYFIQDALGYMRAVVNVGENMANPAPHYAEHKKIISDNFDIFQIQTRIKAFPDVGERFLAYLFPEYGQWWTETMIKEHPDRWMRQTIAIINNIPDEQSRREYAAICRSNLNKFASTDVLDTVPQTLAAEWASLFLTDPAQIKQAALTMKQAGNQKLVGMILLGVIGWFGFKELTKKR